MEKDLFESPKSLLRWAYEDSVQYKKLEESFFSSEPTEQFVEYDVDMERDAQRLRFNEQPSDQMRKLVSHIVNDLRHALDQACYIAAHHFGWKKSRKIPNLYFPWATSPADLQGRLKSIPIELHQLILDAEPFGKQSNNEEGNDVIRELGKIAGPNKHQVALTGQAMRLENTI